MTAVAPSRVQAGADAVGFGPLTARFRHPNWRIYAFVWGGWLVMLAGLLLVSLVGLVMNPPPDAGFQRWLVIVLILAVEAALTYWLYVGTVGNVKRHSFYLYPQGFLIETAFGRVKSVTRWEDVTSLMAVPMMDAGARILYRIERRRGLAVKFTEIIGREVLGPALQRLHAESAETSH